MVDEQRELFATLYAQRLFFLVTPKLPKGFAFEALGRSNARLLVEERMRDLRRRGSQSEYDLIQKTYQKTFQ